MGIMQKYREWKENRDYMQSKIALRDMGAYAIIDGSKPEISGSVSMVVDNVCMRIGTNNCKGIVLVPNDRVSGEHRILNNGKELDFTMNSDGSLGEAGISALREAGYDIGNENIFLENLKVSTRTRCDRKPSHCYTYFSGENTNFEAVGYDVAIKRDAMMTVKEWIKLQNACNYLQDRLNRKLDKRFETLNDDAGMNR